jgi:hypothetical protein
LRFEPADNPDHEVLTALSRCYSALGDEDVLLGIFSPLCSSPDAQLGFSLSLVGDYERALYTFRKVLDAEPPLCSNAEIDVCEDGFMDALVNLCKWTDVHESILSDLNFKPFGIAESRE